MVRFLKEICRFVYGELTEPAAALGPLRKELKQVMEPLREREGFEELEENCMEVSCCGRGGNSALAADRKDVIVWQWIRMGSLCRRESGSGPMGSMRAG